jgi:hypothetical protein
MFLMYLDESGNEKGAEDRYFVLAGAAVHERQTYFLSQRLDQIQANRLPGLPPEPFHAAPIRAGSGFWRKVGEATRAGILDDLGMAMRSAPQGQIALFAAAVEKSATVHGERAVALATEEVCKRFDRFLQREHEEHQNSQRGLLIFAEGRFHQRARLWVEDFRELGTRWGAIHNLSDIPYFASAGDTRLLQVADYVAHATWRLFEKRDASLIKGILPRFDQWNGALHGIAHVRSGAGGTCDCPACSSRREPGKLGSWV